MQCILEPVVLEQQRKKHNLQPYKVRQIEQAIFHHSIIDFMDMTTLSIDLRMALQKDTIIVPLVLDSIQETTQTTKFLFKTMDSKILETVLMYHFHKHNHKKTLNRMTLCISSQVGCSVGCVFCVTGKLGLQKNLHWTEIVGQVLYANYYIKCRFGKKPDGTLYKVRNVVFMGMGEPLLNYENVKKACYYLASPNYLGLSRRRITISTSGVLPVLQQFIQDNLPVRLAFSLHAPTQQLREQLVPVLGKLYTLENLLNVLDTYTKQTGNEVMYEYVMIKNLNDTEILAHQLGKLLKNKKAHVNLIPYNENPLVSMEESNPSQVRRFQKILHSYGIPVTVRENMGRETHSACGQLGYEQVLASAK